MKRFQLQGDLYTEVRGVVAELPAVGDSGLPLLLGWDDLLVPDVFADD